MIYIITLFMLSCTSTNTYNLDVSGVKIDAFGKRANYIDSVDNRSNDRIDYNDKERQKEEVENLKKEVIWEEEVKDMDAGIQEIVTALTSAIAGVYCLVKTIINIVKKLKK